jgi:hypothetical protein
MIIHTGVFVTKETKKTVSINFEMKTECNTLLTSTIVETGRSKRQEAALRAWFILTEHIARL